MLHHPATPDRSQGLGSGLWVGMHVLTLCRYTTQGLACCCHDRAGQNQACQDTQNPARGLLNTNSLTHTDPHSHSPQPCHGTSTCLTHKALNTAPPTPSHLGCSAKGCKNVCSCIYGTHWHSTPPTPQLQCLVMSPPLVIASSSLAVMPM